MLTMQTRAVRHDVDAEATVRTTAAPPTSIRSTYRYITSHILSQTNLKSRIDKIQRFPRRLRHKVADSLTYTDFYRMSSLHLLLLFYILSD